MYLVYGVGKIGKEFLGECRKANIENLLACDNNEKLHSTKYMGYSIENPQRIDFSRIKMIIVATGIDNYQEIEIELKKRCGNDLKIQHYLNVAIVAGEDKLYTGSLRFNEEVPITKGIYTHLELVEKFDITTYNDLDRFIYMSEHKRIHKFIHYTEIYNRYLERFRGKKIVLLEIGVFGGGSLQMWKNYFSVNGGEVMCYGIDINPECKKLEEEGIKIFIGSQEDREFLKYVKQEIGKVDIVIDDGGHTMNQQIVSYEELFEALSDDGVYFCEDTHTNYWNEFGGEFQNPSTFIEYSKNLIDGLHMQYIKNYGEIKKKVEYDNQIKSISYFDSVVVIEKKRKTEKSLALIIE